MNKQRNRRPRTYGRGKRNKAECPTDIVQINHRMMDALRTRIEIAATENGCSINTEMNRRLEQSFWLEDLLKARLISMRVPAGSKETE